jgi:hypothetical protein
MSIAARERRLTAVPGGAPGEDPGRDAGGAIRLARAIAREGDAFRVRVGGAEWLAECDPSVDPALVDAAIASGARVVLEDGPAPVIVGALATRRAVEVNRAGEVELAVKRFRVAADEEISLRTDSAFLRARRGEVEIFGRRVLSRAREVVRILARAIQLN